MDPKKFQMLLELRLGKGHSLQMDTRFGHWWVFYQGVTGPPCRVLKIKGDDGSPREPEERDLDKLQEMDRRAEKYRRMKDGARQLIDDVYTRQEQQAEKEWEDAFGEYTREEVAPRVRWMLKHGRVYGTGGRGVPGRAKARNSRVARAHRGTPL